AAEPVVEQDRQRVVCLVHDVDHERLHLLIAQPRKSRPGNLAVGRPDYHVCIVTGLRVRSDAGMQILEHGVSEALLPDISRASLSVQDWKRSQARFRLSL